MNMRREFIIFTFASLILTLGCVMKKNQENKLVKEAFDKAEKQLKYVAQKPADTTGIPRSTNKDGSFHGVKPGDWTCGFFPGSLWYTYEFTKNEQWKKDAEKWTNILEKVKNQKNTHDLGFMLFCSFGNGYRLTGNPKYKEVIIEGSNTLIKRFNPKVGCIKSWDRYPWSAKWQYPVIIDNMMNLEMLFWATRETGDSIYYNIAKTHALTTLKNHFRNDFSSYHVVNYDSITGEVITRGTHQGCADESAWARGQGWGLYGYTMCYRETKDKTFLEHAEKIANYILTHKNMPGDMVPYWDLFAPDIPKSPRDASAAALIASGLLELSEYSPKNKEEYFKAAEKILKCLASDQYTAEPGTNQYFILKHSTGNYPSNSEIDAPLSYADYYYLEALLRYNKILERRN
ncbi:MAG: glycoside hydrolase family 88 protein [Cytophagaceae bacterium]|nr:glycoside hydrolase family 88 protein [Cytophagaceae bacterium]